VTPRPVPDTETLERVALGTAPGRWLLLVTVLASGMAFLDATAVTVADPARRLAG
jgi:hypothetical protein